jgi:uncharacterized protein YggU (UPF0235/DUF167 family)
MSMVCSPSLLRELGAFSRFRLPHRRKPGRANEGRLRLLARTWHLPHRDLPIIVGSTSRDKVVRVGGDPRQLIDKIISKIASLPGW